jgi:glycosyltransferase involved in cell wall biosynthesis
MKVAFVPPWYGQNIPGGAEAETRRTVEHLHQAGVDVEVLTTCVKDFKSDWARNYHQPGESVENGVLVRRFPVRPRDRQAFDAVNLRLMTNQRISAQEEQTYISESVRSPALTTYIAEHQQDTLYFFIPYLFGTTYWGIRACAQHAFLIPCLHDESYARMDVFRDMFERVAGVVLHTVPEKRLAQSLYNLDDAKVHLVGEGVDTDWSADAERFRAKYNLTMPFLLYAGRKDSGKNVDLLIKYFRRYRQICDRDLALVLLGGGELPFNNRNR